MKIEGFKTLAHQHIPRFPRFPRYVYRGQLLERGMCILSPCAWILPWKAWKRGKPLHTTVFCMQSLEFCRGTPVESVEFAVETEDSSVFEPRPVGVSSVVFGKYQDESSLAHCLRQGFVVRSGDRPSVFLCERGIPNLPWRSGDCRAAAGEEIVPDQFRYAVFKRIPSSVILLHGGGCPPQFLRQMRGCAFLYGLD